MGSIGGIECLACFVFGGMKDVVRHHVDVELNALCIGEKLEKLYEKGNRIEREELYDEALQAWQKGYAMMPINLRLEMDVTNRFWVAIGDTYFLRERMYQKA